MKTTLTSLKNKYNAARNAESDIVAFIDEKKKVVEKLKAAEVKAAEADNVTEYQKLKAERVAAEDAIFVKNAVLEKNRNHYLDLDEAKKVWNDYASNYSAELKAKTAAFNKAAKAACDAFREMAELQAQALIDRKVCGEMCGLEKYQELSIFEMDYIDKTQHVGCAPAHGVPAIAFFLMSGLMSTEDAARLGGAIEHRGQFL